MTDCSQSAMLNDTRADGYQRGVNDAVLWLVANYATHKPEYLAENMLEEFNND